MAEQEQLIIEISAETVGLVRALANAQNGLQDFAKEGKTTAATMTTALSAINKEAKNTFDVNALANYNKALQEIRGTLGNVRKIGVEKVAEGLDKVDESSRRARIAVYGLNQVVRDAPFGFIAISNNIPVLIDQLQALYQQERSVRGAFKEFAKGLVGAGGVTLALGVAFSAVTALVKEYGSLRAAFQAITTDFGPLLQKVREATAEFDKLNAAANDVSKLQIKAGISVEQEIKDIQVLTRALSDENTTRAEKETIIGKIQSANAGLFNDYIIEANRIDQVNSALIIYNGLLTAQEETKAFREEIGKNNKFIFEQTSLLKDIGVQLGIAQTRYNAAQLAVKNFNGAVAPGAVPAVVREYEKAGQALNILKTQYQTIIGNIDQFIKKNDELRNAVDQGIISEIQAQSKLKEFLDANFTTKKEAARIEKEGAKSAKDALKTEQDSLKESIRLLQAKINLEKGALETIDDTSEESLQKRLNVLNLENELKKLQLSEQIKDAKEYAKVVYALDLQLVKDREAIYKNWADNRIKAIGRVLDAEMKYIEQTTEESTKQDPGGAQRRVKEFFKTLGEQNKAIDASLKQQSKAYNDFAKNLASNFANIAGDLAEAFINGQNAAEVFRSSLKRLIADLVVTIAKAAILRTITSAIGGGGGFAASTGGLLGGGGGFNLFDFFGARAEAISGNAPRPRGVNIGAGGMALSGNVTFVQRGTDLVGVLNAGNARIKRVG